MTIQTAADILLSIVLPFILRVTAIYVAFALCASLACRFLEPCAELFRTSAAKTLPYFLIAAALAVVSG